MRLERRSVLFCALVLAACGGDGSSKEPGGAVSQADVARYCDSFCGKVLECADEWSSEAECEADCERVADSSLTRADYLAALGQCEQKQSCDELWYGDAAQQCVDEVLTKLAPTARGQAFCRDNEATLAGCGFFEDELSCTDWVTALADTALARLDDCADESGCGDIFACMDSVFDADRQSGGECAFRDDGECDEPEGTGACGEGSDPNDCDGDFVVGDGGDGSTGDGVDGWDPDVCEYTNDGECDEPEGTGSCAEGTDVDDCSGGGGGDGSSPVCEFTNDGECDEPEGTGSCAEGTDVDDCSGVVPGPSSCEYVGDGECDEPEGTGSCAEGTDVDDCSGGGGDGSSVCEYTNDGECDEGTLCEVGTDTADCL